jgi:2-oxoglutarate ferredoxin oxidoreductase subunit gamma
MSEPFKIVICGEGGQGVLSIAKTMAYAAWLQGKKAVYVPYFSTEKRGGTSVAFAQIGDEDIPFPKFEKADLWVAMSQRAIERIYDVLKDDSKIIVNSTLVHDLSRIEKWQPFSVDAGNIAKVQLKKPRTFNMVLMGAMVALTPGLDKESFGKALEKTFKDKYVTDPGLKALNEKAFGIGFDLIKR